MPENVPEGLALQVEWSLSAKRLGSLQALTAEAQAGTLSEPGIFTPNTSVTDIQWFPSSLHETRGGLIVSSSSTQGERKRGDTDCTTIFTFRKKKKPATDPTQCLCDNFVGGTIGLVVDNASRAGALACGPSQGFTTV